MFPLSNNEGVGGPYTRDISIRESEVPVEETKRKIYNSTVKTLRENIHFFTFPFILFRSFAFSPALPVSGDVLLPGRIEGGGSGGEEEDEEEEEFICWNKVSF